MPEAPVAEAPAAVSKGAAVAKPKETKPKAPEKKERLSLRDFVTKRVKAGMPKGDSAGQVQISSTSKHVLSKVRYVLTTGIDPFDDLVGAFPFGRVSEVYGPESCGKTQLMIKCAIRAQTLNIAEVVRKGGQVRLVPLNKKKVVMFVLYVDNEQSIDEDEKIIHDGVELDVELLRCDTVDQLFKNVEIAVDACAAYQKEDPDTLYLAVGIVDTIASTSSKEELTQEWSKEDYSRHAKQYRKGFRIMVRKLNRVNVALICTNQISDTYGEKAKGKKGGGINPDDYATFGGKALKYYSSCRVYLQKLRDYKINPKSKFANGMLILFRSMKNRVKKPFREGRMVILFGDGEGKGGGFSNEFSILETLMYMKYAEYSEATKAISFKFAKFKIPTTTFETAAVQTTLEEDDAQKPDEMSSRRGKKDPSIALRAAWPAFYAEHKADVDALYQASIDAAFAAETMPVEGEEDDENDEFEEEEP
jgi:recombination protein RecA